MQITRNTLQFVFVFLVGFSGHVASQERQAPAVKFSVPNKAETDKVESAAKEALASISKTESDKDFQERISLAKSEPDPVKKWTILQLLVSDAIESQNPRVVMQVCSCLEESFDFASHELVIQSLVRLEKKQKRPEERLATMGPLIASARVALNNSDFTAVDMVCSYDVRRLPKSEQKKIKLFLAGLQSASNSKRNFADRCSEARKVLARMPDDKDANLLVALYECCLGQGLGNAFEYISRSGNERLQSIARLEVDDSKSLDDYRQLADLWWETSKEVPESCRRRAILRSAACYENCIESLNGLDLAVAKKRIESSYTEELIPVIRVDLLQSDLRRSFKNGALDGNQKQLRLGSAGPSYCQFFPPLNDNYDLEYKFSREDNKWGIAFFFFERNRPFMWHFSGSANPSMGFAGFQESLGPKNNSNSTITDRQTHTLLLRIRPNRFEAILDGKLESDIRNPLKSKEKGTNHPTELTNKPSLSIVDWWGVTTVQSATYTEFW